MQESAKPERAYGFPDMTRLLSVEIVGNNRQLIASSNFFKKITSWRIFLDTPKFVKAQHIIVFVSEEVYVNESQVNRPTQLVKYILSIVFQRSLMCTLLSIIKKGFWGYLRHGDSFRSSWQGRFHGCFVFYFLPTKPCYWKFGLVWLKSVGISN